MPNNIGNRSQTRRNLWPARPGWGRQNHSPAHAGRHLETHVWFGHSADLDLHRTEIKANHMQGQVIEINCDEPGQAEKEIGW